MTAVTVSEMPTVNVPVRKSVVNCALENSRVIFRVPVPDRLHELRKQLRNAATIRVVESLPRVGDPTTII